MLFLWNRGQTESIVAVICQGIGRVIAVQIHDITSDGMPTVRIWNATFRSQIRRRMWM